MVAVKKKSHLSNNKGMGLPVVMLFSALGIIFIGTLVGLISNSAKSTSNRSNITEFETFSENMKQTIEDVGACTYLLRNKVISLVPGDETRITLDHDFDPVSPELDTNWQNPEKTFKVGSVVVEALGLTNLITGDPVEVRRIRPHNSANELYTFPVRIKINPTELRTVLRDETNSALILQNQKAFEGQVPLMKQSLDAKVFANVQLIGPISAGQGIIQSCYGYKSDASVCAATGGTYDVAETDAAKKCKPDKRCFPSKAGVVHSMSACLPPFDSHISYLGAMGGVDSYLCSWCHPFPGP